MFFGGAVDEVDLVLGTTRVPRTRERSSSPAWVGEMGEGKDGRTGAPPRGEATLTLV